MAPPVGPTVRDGGAQQVCQRRERGRRRLLEHTHTPRESGRAITYATSDKIRPRKPLLVRTGSAQRTPDQIKISTGKDLVAVEEEHQKVGGLGVAAAGRGKARRGWPFAHHRALEAGKDAHLPFKSDRLETQRNSRNSTRATASTQRNSRKPAVTRTATAATKAVQCREKASDQTIGTRAKSQIRTT